MGLFSKSKKKEAVVENVIVIKTADKLIAQQLTDDSDEFLTGLAKKLIEGSPLILDFSPLQIDPANKAMAFFSGVVFAVGGDIASIRDKIFLFYGKDAFADGSLQEYLNQI